MLNEKKRYKSAIKTEVAGIIPATRNLILYERLDYYRPEHGVPGPPDVCVLPVNIVIVPLLQISTPTLFPVTVLPVIVLTVPA